MENGPEFSNEVAGNLHKNYCVVIIFCFSFEMWHLIIWIYTVTREIDGNILNLIKKFLYAETCN